MCNKIPGISNEEVIFPFSTGVADIKMKEKLSMNDELTSVLRLFEIANRYTKAQEGRLFVHNLSEAPLPKSKQRTPSARRLFSSRWSLSRSTATETALSATRVDDAVTASSTSVTPTIPDEDIPITPPLSPTPIDDEDVVAKKSNEIWIGPITRARAMQLE
jgi:hypothetical protein